jgi:probable phosphoglycerate mutase
VGNEATWVTFVRHGETEHNRTNRYMGRLEGGITDLGRDQAGRAARRLAREAPFDALYVSPLRRTRETAAYLEEALGLVASPDPGFLEIDLGPWEDRDRAEVAAEDPERWAVWLRDPSRVRVEGMETIDEVKARVGAALDALVTSHPGGRIVVVTHFACVVTAVLHVLELPSSAYRRFPVDNASLTTLRLGALGKLRRFNDTAHLAADDAPLADQDS